MIMPQNLPVQFCSFTGSFILLIRISAKLDVDLCVTFLNFQADCIWKDFVNMITLHKLLASSCSLTSVLHIILLNEFDVDLCVTF